MAVFNGVRLVSLAVLVLVSQLDSASAAVRVFGLRARASPVTFLKIISIHTSRSGVDLLLGRQKVSMMTIILHGL